MVTIPRAELEALKAELRRLRQVEADAEVRRRLKEFVDAGGPAAVSGPVFTASAPHRLTRAGSRPAHWV